MRANPVSAGIADKWGHREPSFWRETAPGRSANAASLSIVARRKEERRRHDLSPGGQTGPGACILSGNFVDYCHVCVRHANAFRYPFVTPWQNVKTIRLESALFPREKLRGPSVMAF
jgi:hypothetical protein